MTRKAVLGFFVGLVLGLLPWSAGKLLDAHLRSIAKRTAAECRVLSNALEAYRKDNGQYPPISEDVRDLEPYLVPRYVKHVPTESFVSGEPLLVVLHGDRAAVIATGRYGFAVEAGQVIGTPPW